MTHELSLVLDLLAEEAKSLLFRVLLRNRSAVRLLLPYPEIHNLHFGDKNTHRECEWYFSVFVDSTWAGFVLAPGEEKAIEYRVRPSSVPRPAENDCSDYYRWCVDLLGGEYLVWFQLEAGEDYFCPDSHYRYADLQREAAAERAVVWTGRARSNTLNLVRT